MTFFILKCALAALFLSVGIFAATNLQEKKQVSDLTLANIEAMTFDNDGDSYWFDNEHWYSDGTTDGGNWNPIYESCTSSSIYVHKIRCSSGGGNCWNGTGCIKGS